MCSHSDASLAIAPALASPYRLHLLWQDRALRDGFGQSYVAYGEGPADMNRSAELYLIGSVRNPCAWLVSMWGCRILFINLDKRSVL